MLVCELLLLGNSQSVDAKEIANTRDDQVCPAEVDDGREDEVAVQIVQLSLSTDAQEAQTWKVGERGTTNKGHKHDGPVRERLLREVSENHLRSQPAEYESHGDAEENKVVVATNGRVRRVDPGANSESVHCHGRPLEEDRGYGLTARATGLNDVENAEGDVSCEEREDDHGNPDVPNRVVSQQVMEAIKVLFGLVAEDVDDGLSPDARAVDSRYNHDTAGDQNTFGRTVDPA